MYTILSMFWFLNKLVEKIDNDIINDNILMDDIDKHVGYVKRCEDPTYEAFGNGELSSHTLFLDT